MVADDFESNHYSAAMMQNIFSNHNVLCKLVLAKNSFYTISLHWTHDENKDFIVEKVEKD